MAEDADLVDRAVEQLLGRGVRTADIVAPGLKATSTTEMGKALLGELEQLAG